jgi:transglutaminase-like putative cysteine protease
MNPRPYSFAELGPLVLCLALALAAHWDSLPGWVLVTVAVCAGVRLLLAHRGRPAPPRAVRLAISTLAVALLFLQFRTFNGLSAGYALLALAAGLKVLETNGRRDVHVVTLSVFLVGVAALLEADSFWLLAYLIAVCGLAIAALLRLTSAPPVPDWRPSLRYCGRILAQAVPLAVVCWLFFPRFGGPLWQMPDDGGYADTGLSDRMSPGDIDRLAMSDDIAFRVHFAAAAPPPREMYWRGPVMHHFDGHTWTQALPANLSAPPTQPRGPAYRYTLKLEPYGHGWIFALDWPSQWDLPHGALTGDYTLVQPDRVSRPIDVAVTSYTHVASAAPLSASWRQLDSAPLLRNPRTLEFAHGLRAAHPADLDYVHAVLALFAQQPFYYTLKPPRLAGDSVDEFLFDTRRGFCGHYASAFAALIRAAGIPARVVTGYQGGTFNRFDDDWIVRQSDAHAWDEVWIEGSGWLRVDPTSAVDPRRVDGSLREAPGADERSQSRWQRRTVWFADARLRFDALRELWRESFLLFDQDSQQQVLAWLDIPEPDGRKLAGVLSVGLLLVFSWLTWQVRREVDPPRKDPLLRAYARLCDKLAAAGVPRHPHEGAEDYSTRVAQRRPDLGPAVTSLCRRYSQLRYSAAGGGGAVAQFAAGVRAFRCRLKPRDSRAS